MKKIIPHILFITLLCLLAVIDVQAQDIMSQGGTLTTNTFGSTFPGGENPPKAVDNDVNTKLLLFNFTKVELQWQCNTPAIAAQYSITSANDAPERDPKAWTLEGSNDASNWTTLDTKTNESFNTRFLTKIYSIPNTTAYTYYRLTITAIWNNPTTTLYQMAEWRLLEGIKPAAPTALQTTTLSGGQIALAWTDNANNESGFDIERSTNGTTFTKVGTAAGNITAYVDNDLVMNTQYFYRVAAKNDYGVSAHSNTANSTTLSIGGALSDITDDGGNRDNGRYKVQYDTLATPGGERPEKLIDNDFNSKYLIFTGTPPNFPATADYWVQYEGNKLSVLRYYTITSANDAPTRDPFNWELLGSTDGNNWTVIDTRAAELFNARFQTRLFYTTSNTTPYKFYRWHVTANAGAGNIAGQIGEWELFAFDPNAPIPPKDVNITAVTDTTMTLEWVDQSNTESGFEISRSEDGINFISVATTAANATTYTDEFLLPGFQYFYRVRAVSTAGASFWSNVDEATTTFDPALPLTPRALTATGISETEIELNWEDRSNNEDSFYIERSANGTLFTKIGAVEPNITTYVDTDRTVATKYFYRVRAINVVGNSYYSNVGEGITTGTNQPPVMDAVDNVSTCKINTAQTITITGINAGPESWQTVSLTVSSGNSNLFDSLEVSDVTNGQATIRYKTKSTGGVATITVTAKDNGLSWNGGSDSKTQTFTISVSPLPVAITSGAGKTVARWADVQLTASGANNYAWENANGIVSGQNSATLNIRPTLNTIYKVTGSNAQGCSNTAEIAIQVAGPRTIEPVNVLTPNGDGRNDRWVVWNIGLYPDNIVNVYDRNGRLVFTQKNYANDWNGTYRGSPLPEGTYIYVIEPGQGIEPVKGVLTIIRERK